MPKARRLLIKIIAGMAIALSVFPTARLFDPAVMTATFAQCFFLAITVLVIVLLFLLRTYKALKPAHVLWAIIIVGIAVRLVYFLYTDCTERQHDVSHYWGHIQCIEYIAEHGSLPPTGEGQNYHPPVHYICCAVYVAIGRVLHFDNHQALRLAQALMVVFSSLSMVIFYRIVSRAIRGDTARGLALALYAFHPTNILLSAQLNNDNTLVFLYVLCLYFMVKWMDDRKFLSVIGMALTASLTILTKKTAIMLIPIAAVAFAVSYLRKRTQLVRYLLQFGIFVLIVTALGSLHMIRNAILFHQSPLYVMGTPLPKLPSTLYNLVRIPFRTTLADPFVNISDWSKAGLFFLEYLFKSALFGEWAYPGLQGIGVALVILGFIGMMLTLVYLAMVRTKQIGSYDYLFFLNILITLIIYVKFRFDIPTFCTQDFRFIAPVLLSFCYFHGKANEYFMSKRSFFLQSLAFTTSILFYAVSAFFFLRIGI